MAFIDTITGISGLTHYYPLNDTFGGEDAWGGSVDAPATRTNYKHASFVGSGVSFTSGTSSAAQFDGVSLAQSFIQIPDDPAFSVRGGASGEMTIVYFATITDWTPVNDNGGEYIHFMGKGSPTANTLEWGTRHYIDGSAQGDAPARQGRISMYYWKSDGGTGNGSYVNLGDPEPTTEFMCATTIKYSGTFSTGNYIRSFLNGSTAGTAAIQLTGTGALNPLVDGARTTGPVTIGKRLDNTGAMVGKVRRVAFYNKVLSPNDLDTIYNDRASAEGTLAPSPAQGNVTITAGTNASTPSLASTLSVAYPVMGADRVHVIAFSAFASSAVAISGPPAGYTQLDTILHSNSSNTQTWVFYKNGPVATAGNVTITSTSTPSASGRMVAIPFVLNEVDTSGAGTAFEAHANNASLGAPSLTATNAKMLVTVHGARESAQAAGLTFTKPSGMDSEVSHILSAVAATTNTGLAVNQKVITAGATGIQTEGTSPAGIVNGSISFTVVPRPGSIAAAAVKTATLTDTFATFDTAKWTRSSATAVTVNSNKLTINPAVGASENAVTVATSPLDLNSSKIWALVEPVGGSDNATTFGLRSIATTTSDMVFRITNSGGVATISMGRRADGGGGNPAFVGPAGPTGAWDTMSYNAATMKYLQIRQDAAGNVYFETASTRPDPAVPADNPWTVRYTNQSIPTYLNNVQVLFNASVVTATPAATSPAKLSDLNGSAPTPTPAAPTITIANIHDDFTTQDSALWNWGSGAAMSGNQAHVSVGAGTNTLTTQSRYIGTNSYFDAALIPASGGTTPLSVMGWKSQTAGTTFRLEISGGGASATVQAGFQSGGVWASGSPVNLGNWVPGMRVRFREGTANPPGVTPGVAGRFYLDTGLYDSGTSTWLWSQRIDMASPNWMGDVMPFFSASATAGPSSDLIVDNVNALSASVTPIEGQFSPPPPPAAAGGPIFDDFDTLDTTIWDDRSGTPTVTSGSLLLDATATPDKLSSTRRINLTGTSENIEVASSISTTTGYALFRLEVDANNYVQFRFNATVAAVPKITAEQVVAGTLTALGSVSFSAVGSRFVQFREANGTLFWEYGSSPTNMNTLASKVAPIALSNLKLTLIAAV